jgi:hypothetical protein
MHRSVVGVGTEVPERNLEMRPREGDSTARPAKFSCAYVRIEEQRYGSICSYSYPQH